MLSIKIDNTEIESRFKQYASQHQKAIEDVVSDAMKLFLDINKKEDKLVYTKKDPMKYLHTIKYEDDGEDLSDVKLFSHIDNVEKYVHDLRRVRAK